MPQEPTVLTEDEAAAITRLNGVIARHKELIGASELPASDVVMLSALADRIIKGATAPCE